MRLAFGWAEAGIRPARLAALVLIVLAVVAFASRVEASAARHALLIGISEYNRIGFDDLPGAARDLDLVSAVLTSRLGFASGEIRVLRNEDATHRGIERAFSDLAESVAPGDLVFIHYSGHGSLVRDFNDYEPTGQDQTLVPFGARREDSEGIDRFDILDDELNLWLGRISDRIGQSGQLVMVSDACHSATNTRGPSPLVSRAIPAAVQALHPLAQGPADRHPLDNAIRIGAAADLEQAFEFQPDHGGPAGQFTWHWVAALEGAAPGETWRDVFERANLGVTTLMPAVQHPQITGSRADRTILGGALRARLGVRVTRVDDHGLTLNAGLLSGVSVGSLYTAIDPEDDSRVRITKVGDTWSHGRVERGRASVADVLTELEHAYTSKPVRLFLWVLDQSIQADLLQPLRRRFSDLPGFAWAQDQGQSDLTLAVLRPRRIDGEAEFAFTQRARSSIPESDPSAAAEVWVLDRGERLVHEDLTARLTGDDAEIARLAENLARYRRQREIRRLPALGRADMGIRTALIRYEIHAEPCDDCRYIKSRSWYIRRLPTGQPIDVMDQGTWPFDSLLSLALENTSRRDHYVYVFELAPNGWVRSVHPRHRNIPMAPLRSGQTMELPDLDEAILLDHPGRMSVLVIATQEPIEPFLLTQAGFESARRETCPNNPLQCLLQDAVFGTRGTAATGIWGAQLIDFFVEAED